jgi:hypothetical protein
MTTDQHAPVLVLRPSQSERKNQSDQLATGTSALIKVTGQLLQRSLNSRYSLILAGNIAALSSQSATRRAIGANSRPMWVTARTPGAKPERVTGYFRIIAAFPLAAQPRSGVLADDVKPEQAYR